MYHFVLKRILRSAFASINRGEYESIVNQFAPMFEHTFYGEHALGGTRTTPESNRRWYQRLAKIFPDLHFTITTIDVSGWPWNTTASVEWKDRFSGPDGTIHNNQGVHVFRFKWGRVTSLHIYTDTYKLAAILDSFARNGRPEAGETQIEDK